VITWVERAKAAISQKSQDGTAKADETPSVGLLSVSSVSSGPAGAIFEWEKRLSSVLAVPPPAVLEKYDFSIEVV
jgi:hypothetical protein